MILSPYDSYGYAPFCNSQTLIYNRLASISFSSTLSEDKVSKVSLEKFYVKIADRF